MIEVRGWSDSRKGSQAKESRQPPDTKKKKNKGKKRKRKEFSPRGSKRNQPCELLSFSSVKLTFTSGF